MTPLAYVPVFPGTNCHRETAEAFQLAGARSEIVLLQDLLDGRKVLNDCDLIALAGGFSFGDHIRSGRIAALILLNRLRTQLDKVLERKIPMIGICNGFQILVSAGLLPAITPGEPKALLDQNLSTRFEHRLNTEIVFHEVKGCPWLKGLDGFNLRLPVANGEGRFVQLDSECRVDIAASYSQQSPSGSDIAGVACEQILGLMPHPERRRDRLHGGADGLELFYAAVSSVR